MANKNNLIAKLLYYQIIEPEPDKKYEYRYTKKFTKFWEKNKVEYEDYIVNFYAKYHQKTIKKDFISYVLSQYEEELTLEKGRDNYFLEDDRSPSDNEILNALYEEVPFEKAKLKKYRSELGVKERETEGTILDEDE